MEHQEQEPIIEERDTKEKDDLWRAARLKEIPDHVKDYIHTKTELIRINLVESASNAVSGAVMGFLLLFIGTFFLNFLSFAIAFMVAEALDSTFAGFLIVAGFYLLLGILVFTFQDKLINNPIINSIISKAYANDNGTKEQD